MLSKLGIYAGAKTCANVIIVVSQRYVCVFLSSPVSLEGGGEGVGIVC